MSAQILKEGQEVLLQVKISLKQLAEAYVVRTAEDLKTHLNQEPPALFIFRYDGYLICGLYQGGELLFFSRKLQHHPCHPDAFISLFDCRPQHNSSTGCLKFQAQLATLKVLATMLTQPTLLPDASIPEASRRAIETVNNALSGFA
jgi:hypothetical protein